MEEMEELKLDKFKFSEDPWGGAVSMEWYEHGNDYYHGGTDCDIDINKDDAERLILFLASSLKISLRDLASRSRK